jgi:hypothetical protein
MKVLQTGRNTALILFLLTVCQTASAQETAGLRDAVVLVIRHAEKPETGNDLSPAGVERANAYAHYFETFQMDGKPLKLDSLFAAHDSKKSNRPRLTLEPLSRALHLPLDSSFKDKAPEILADELKSRPHGTNILICWHHGKIPDLLGDLGADPSVLLPEGKWPDNIFNWVIELRYDHQGRLIPADCKRVNEALRPGDLP